MKFFDSNKVNPHQETFQAKLDGVIMSLGNELIHCNCKKALDILIESKTDLGTSWEGLFLINFDYSGSMSRNSNVFGDLFYHAIYSLSTIREHKVVEPKPSDAIKLLNFIVENAPIEFAYNSDPSDAALKYLDIHSKIKKLRRDFRKWLRQNQKNNLNRSPLILAADHHEDVALTILKRLDPARRDQDLPMYRAALTNAQKQNFRDLIAVIEERIDYKPPAAVTQMKQKFSADIALPDPREAIENAIQSGSLSDALRIDDQTLMACTKFFERFQNLYAQTLSHADDANAAREALDQRIARLQSSLKTLMDEMDPSTRYESIGQELWIATRNVIPWLNPRRALGNTNIEVTTSINSALEQSYQLIDDCQSFAQAVPKVLDELQKLKTSYAEALTKIDNELDGDLPKNQRELKLQLRSIFEKAQNRVIIMSGDLAMQDLANPTLIATELEFVFGLKDLMVSFSTSATTAINSMALIKMGMTNEMRERIFDSLAQQWDQAEKTARLLRQHGDVEIPKISHQPNDGIPLPQAARQETLLAPVA